MSTTPEAIHSIEWAVLFAALVLSARLFSLIQASVGVARAHRQVVGRLGKEDLGTLGKSTHGLRYRNPYGEIAAALIQASNLAGEDSSKRQEFVARAMHTATVRVRRRTKQGRTADVLALCIGSIVVIYSRGVLPEGPLFWSCAGAMFVTLAATIGARGLLLSNLVQSAEALRDALLARPQLPSLSDDKHPCLWCGAPTQRVKYELRLAGAEDHSVLDLSQCNQCGKLVGTLDPSARISPIT